MVSTQAERLEDPEIAVDRQQEDRHQDVSRERSGNRGNLPVEVAEGGVPYNDGYFGRSKRPVYLSNVQCLGSETNLIGCSHDHISSSSADCHHTTDVGVSCYNQTKGPIQLSSVNCLGNEPTILECDHTSVAGPFPDFSNHESDIGIRCWRNATLDQLPSPYLLITTNAGVLQMGMDGTILP
eukprot:Em0017g781a